MLGDKVTVVVALSKHHTAERVIVATTQGGSVTVKVDDDDMLKVEELSMGGRTIRSESFAMERVIRHAFEPKRAGEPS